MPSYAIASFRSRQQVFGFESALKRAGLRAEVVSTPREVALGCGLSVRFASEDWPRVSEIYRRRPAGQPHWLLSGGSPAGRTAQADAHAGAVRRGGTGRRAPGPKASRRLRGVRTRYLS